MLKKLFNFFNNQQEEIEKALKLEKQGKYTEAMNLITEITKNNPNCKTCRYHLGRLALIVNTECNNNDAQNNTDMKSKK